MVQKSGDHQLKLVVLSQWFFTFQVVAWDFWTISSRRWIHQIWGSFGGYSVELRCFTYPFNASIAAAQAVNVPELLGRHILRANVRKMVVKIRCFIWICLKVLFEFNEVLCWLKEHIETNLKQDVKVKVEQKTDFKKTWLLTFPAGTSQLSCNATWWSWWRPGQWAFCSSRLAKPWILRSRAGSSSFVLGHFCSASECGASRCCSFCACGWWSFVQRGLRSSCCQQTLQHSHQFRHVHDVIRWWVCPHFAREAVRSDGDCSSAIMVATYHIILFALLSLWFSEGWSTSQFWCSTRGVVISAIREQPSRSQGSQLRELAWKVPCDGGKWARPLRCLRLLHGMPRPGSCPKNCWASKVSLQTKLARQSSKPGRLALLGLQPRTVTSMSLLPTTLEEGNGGIVIQRYLSVWSLTISDWSPWLS